MQVLSKIFLVVIFFIISFQLSASFCQEKLSEKQVDSIISKGKQEILDKEWGDAIDTFDDLMYYEPDNLIANYYYAIGERETGRSRNPIERILRYNSCERHLKKIISIDSTFKDTYYQLGVLEFYRHNYFDAVDLAKHQLEINDTLKSALTGIFNLYDIMLEHEGNDKIQIYLKSNNSDYDKYSLGEFYRRVDSLGKAEYVFNAIIKEHVQIPLIPVYLSLVRLYVQENKYEEADAAYWKAVESVSSHAELEMILYDFEYILNAREYKILYAPLKLDKFKEVMRIFWTERNPLPSLPYNMRLIEHYKRLIYAEKNFRYDGVRLNIYDANKLESINHPPWYYLNDKFNDCGIIYIRFGEPDDKIIIPGESLVSKTSWLYEANNRHPRMIFYFMIERDAPPGYWTLVPMLLDPVSLSELEIWDARFHSVDPQHQDTYYKFENEGVKTAERGLTTNSFTWPKEIKPLNAEFTINQFRADDISNLFYLDYAIPLNELTEGEIGNEPVSLKVEVSIFDTSMNPITRKVENLKINKSDKHIYKSMYIDGNSFLLKRQKYIISMDISEPGDNRLFGAYFNFNLSNFSESLSCSSLEQAFRINANDENKESRRNVNILPNPTLKFSKKENVFTYYEVYNLSPDKNGSTSYSVNFDIHLKDQSKSIWDFFSGLFRNNKDYNISISNNYKDVNKDAANYLAFDISELENGVYEMVLNIKDNNNGKETSTSSELIVQ